MHLMSKIFLCRRFWRYHLLLCCKCQVSGLVRKCNYDATCLTRINSLGGEALWLLAIAAKQNAAIGICFRQRRIHHYRVFDVGRSPLCGNPAHDLMNLAHALARVALPSLPPSLPPPSPLLGAGPEALG
eukprot:jgi/Botrbrau1/15424/Bobra.43_2s0050.1